VIDHAGSIDIQLGIFGEPETADWGWLLLLKKTGFDS
jgi:hypothetical protein